MMKGFSSGLVIIVVAILAAFGGWWYWTGDGTMPPGEAESPIGGPVSETGDDASGGSQAEETSAGGTSGGGTAAAGSIDGALAGFSTNGSGEATQANSENGTESVTQLNGSLNNQTIYAQ